MGVRRRRGVIATLLTVSTALVLSMTTVPAASAATAPTGGLTDRQRVVDLWQNSGPTVRAAAQQATLAL